MFNFLQNKNSNNIALQQQQNEQTIANLKTQALSDVLNNLLAYQESIKKNPNNLGYSQKSLDLINKVGADKVSNGVSQGLNYGVPEISDYENQFAGGAGKEAGYRIPQTPDEIALAKQGQFNVMPAFSTGVQGTQEPQAVARKSVLDSFLNGLSDLENGARENFTTPFAVNNLRPDENKSMMNKVGEGVGTVFRGLNSPYGRAGLVGLAVKGTGGSNLQAMGYGAKAASKSIENQTQNSLYRTQLKKMGYSDEEIAQMPGYIKMGDFRALSDGIYKQNYTNYRDKKLDQDSYLKSKKMFDDLLLKGSLSPEQHKQAVEELNSMLIDGNIITTKGGEVKESNDTRKTDSTIDLNGKRGKYMDVMSEEQPKRTGIMQQNANSNSSRANSYAKKSSGGGRSSSKLENNPDYRTHLAEYSTIKGSGDKNKVNYAKNQFIKMYGIDPDKKIKSESDILEFLNND